MGGDGIPILSPPDKEVFYMARCSNIAKVFGGPGYENLANAVVYLACEDWRLENKWLKAHKSYEFSENHKKREQYEQHLQAKDEIEYFFLSGWFGLFTTIDPIWLLKTLENEDLLPQARPIRSKTKLFV